MMTQCCKDCQERHEACWGHCEKYQEAKAKHEAARQARAKQLATDRAARDIQYHGLTKWREDKQKRRLKY